MITAMPRIAIAMQDFDAACRFFSEELGMPVVDFSDATVADLGAHVGMCMPPGGSNIELMAPANPNLPLSQSLQRFLDRRGEGFYALMLEAADPNEEAEELAGRGIDVLPLMAGAGGRDLHPRSTHGVLIRVYPNGSVQDPGGLVTKSPHFSGINRVVVATRDANAAAKIYGHGLGLDVSAAVVDDERGLVTVTVTPPKGGVIELVSVDNAARPAAAEVSSFLATRGEGMFSLELSSQDAVDAPFTAFGARFEVSR